jgi:hypothetical protein
MVVNYGNIQSTYLLQVTLTPVLVTTVTAAEQSFTIPGLLIGDQISDVSYLGAWTVAVSVTNYRVSAANTLSISYYNGTAGSVTPPAGTYLVEVNRPVQLPLGSVIQ